MSLNSLNRRKSAQLFLLVFCIPVAAAALIAFVISPSRSTSSANQKLKTLIESEGHISGLNTNNVSYSGIAIRGAVAHQQALALNGTASSPGEFIFTNRKNSNESKHNNLTLYMDFSTRQSQEFSLIEQNYLKSLVEFGQVNLTIYAIPSSSSYSIYAPEVLAEAFTSNPQEGWNVFIRLMQFSAQLENGPESNSAIVNQLVNIAHQSGISGITRQSILDGRYTSWILASSHDSVVRGVSLPLVELNGQTINITAHTFYSQDGLEKYVESHLRKS